jgi:nucleotide-binding universal stress UspA family protein
MYNNILVSLDLGDSQMATKALNTAVDYAKVFGARLHVMTVVPDYGMSIVGDFFPKTHEKEALAHADTALHTFTRSTIPEGIKHRHIVAHGSIYREILHYGTVAKADLIILAAATPGPEDFLIGPNAARVVRHAKISVLVVR